MRGPASSSLPLPRLRLASSALRRSDRSDGSSDRCELSSSSFERLHGQRGPSSTTGETRDMGVTLGDALQGVRAARRRATVALFEELHLLGR